MGEEAGGDLKQQQQRRSCFAWRSDMWLCFTEEHFTQFRSKFSNCSCLFSIILLQALTWQWQRLCIILCLLSGPSICYLSGGAILPRPLVLNS